MNGKRARALRKIATDRENYQALKAAWQQDAGQRPKAVAARRHKRKLGIKPTWPATLDQHRQSRPLIVAHPVRALCVGWQDAAAAQIRAEWRGVPKWAIDRAASTGHTA